MMFYLEMDYHHCASSNHLLVFVNFPSADVAFCYIIEYEMIMRFLNLKIQILHVLLYSAFIIIIVTVCEKMKINKVL